MPPSFLHGCSIVGGILWYLCSDKLYGSKGNQLMNKLHLSKRAFSGKEFICIPSSFIDFLHMLHAAHREEFCKAAAFLDYLAENGARGDKVVCRYPEGMIYMHCIPGIEKHSGGKSAGAGNNRAGPVSLWKGSGSGKEGSFSKPAVCVILYSQSCEEADNGDSFVILHHFFTDRVPAGIPLRHLQQAVCRQRRYRRF